MRKIKIVLFVCLSVLLPTTGLFAQPPKSKPNTATVKKVIPKQAPKETVKEVPKEVVKESTFDYGYGTKDAAILTFGPQQWIAKNLVVTTFANGDKIEQVQSNEEWVKAGKELRPAWCYYENDPANGQTYGILYNWYAVSDPRGLAPKGWHVPSKYEWIPFLDFLGSRDEGGHKMKSTTLWQPDRWSG